ncbi:MAG: adenylyltransferase/cytidyltransferase family protein [Victivallales bacterium]|jgi:rfaE bifunctional protein nucleotidyltransferase chain/domain|nr:adenylyltransferase/cytidyltransferase family protein [Victivallales bacterium]
MNKNPVAGIMTLSEAKIWREKLRAEGRRLVITNGCFDILHRGHAEYLYESRLLGDALLVLVNSDASVCGLKGPERPLVDQYNRCYMLCALSSVDAAVVFDGERCDRQLRELSADIYVKGGDYTLDRLDPAERAALEEVGTRICFKPFVPGFSTTMIVEKIRRG